VVQEAVCRGDRGRHDQAEIEIDIEIETDIETDIEIDIGKAAARRPVTSDVTRKKR